MQLCDRGGLSLKFRIIKVSISLSSQILEATLKVRGRGGLRKDEDFVRFMTPAACGLITAVY